MLNRKAVVVSKTTGVVLRDTELYAMNNDEVIRIIEARIGRFPVRLALDPRTGCVRA